MLNDMEITFNFTKQFFVILVEHVSYQQCIVVVNLKSLEPPTGPTWWPVIGNTSLLRNLSRKLKGQHLALSQLAHDYDTSVLGLKLGRDLVVVVFTAPLVREILSREDFLGRPDTFFIRLRSFGKRQGTVQQTKPDSDPL